MHQIIRLSFIAIDTCVLGTALGVLVTSALPGDFSQQAEFFGELLQLLALLLLVACAVFARHVPGLVQGSLVSLLVAIGLVCFSTFFMHEQLGSIVSR